MHDATDYWDGNWLTSPIDLQAGGIRASIGAGLRANELVDFRKQLEPMHETLAGSAELESMEDWLTLRIEIDGSGRLEVRGQVCDAPGIGNSVTFEIRDLDQTDLAEIVRGLREIEAAFPTVGEPPEG
jgi:hypothetical protein